MVLLAIVSAAAVSFSDVPPPPPGSTVERRPIEVAVTFDRQTRGEGRVQIRLSIHNRERRAYCIANDLVPSGQQEPPSLVRIYDSRGTEVEFVGRSRDWSPVSDGEPTVFVAVRPGSTVNRIVLAGEDYNFPSQTDSYIARVKFGGFYCDELNFGRKETPILFSGQSAPFYAR
jgi:hypothetical protein